jgi:outer membrane lipopolysaccharide assembly protein LptE/RlpB
MRARGSLFVLLLAVVLGGSGCGYSWRGTLPEHIRTVAVPVFKNKTSEPAVENFLTRAIVEAFSTNGRLRVVTPERADSILEGEVVGYEVQSVAFDPRVNVRQYRLIVTLNLRYRDVRQERVLLERAGLQERADFRVPGAVSETIAREEAAVRTAAAEIARSVVSLTLERF